MKEEKKEGRLEGEKEEKEKQICYLSVCLSIEVSSNISEVHSYVSYRISFSEEKICVLIRALMWRVMARQKKCRAYLCGYSKNNCY